MAEIDTSFSRKAKDTVGIIQCLAPIPMSNYLGRWICWWSSPGTNRSAF